MTKHAYQTATQAVVDTLPLSIAVVPWGILTGALAIQIGLDAWQSQCLSLLVFAGAAQLSGISMLASGTAAVPIFVSTMVISSRHLLYSIIFRAHVAKLNLAWRLGLSFLLTDEMFAVSEAHTKRVGEFSALFAAVSGFSFYVAWNLATLIGIVAGESFKNLESLGLDFAIVATFIAMTLNQINTRPEVVAVLVSGVLAVMLRPHFSESYIVIAALFGMLSAYLVDVKLSKEVTQ